MILRNILSRLVAIAPRRERVAAPLFAFLLLSSAVGAPIGTAAADSSTEECSGVDAIVYDMTTIDGIWSMQDKEEHPCSPSYQRAQAIEELKNDSAEQEELDIYNAALEQKANNEVFSDVSDNYLNDSRSIAWMHAETAMANAYKNGSSEAVAKAEAREAIESYYASKQMNMIERWNVSVRAMLSAEEVAQNQSEVSDDLVQMSFAYGGDTYWRGLEENLVTKEVELVNGSTKDVLMMKGYSNSDYTVFYGVWGTKKGDGSDTDVASSQQSDIRVKGPTENHDDVFLMKSQGYETAWDQTQAMNSDLQSEVDPFVNSTWTAYQNGEINASDVISRNNLMFRYGTDALNNSNQSLYDSTAALSTMGLDTPNINSTGSMTVEYEGVTYEGMVLAQEAPNGTWETGTTYNTSNIGGTVLLATTDGQRIDMKGEFTLQEMKNQDGDQIEETQATKVVYKTSNTSELLDKMDRIIELRQQIEATKPKASTGGGDSGDGSGLLKALASFLGISAGAAAVVLIGAGVLVFKIYTP